MNKPTRDQYRTKDFLCAIKTMAYIDDLEKYIEYLEQKEAQLQQHGVSGKRPTEKQIEIEARKHASSILGFAPNEVLPDDTNLVGFKAGASWALSQAACASAKGGPAED